MATGRGSCHPAAPGGHTLSPSNWSARSRDARCRTAVSSLSVQQRAIIDARPQPRHRRSRARPRASGKRPRRLQLSRSPLHSTHSACSQGFYARRFGFRGGGHPPPRAAGAGRTAGGRPALMTLPARGPATAASTASLNRRGTRRIVRPRVEGAEPSPALVYTRGMLAPDIQRTACRQGCRARRPDRILERSRIGGAPVAPRRRQPGLPARPRTSATSCRPRRTRAST